MSWRRVSGKPENQHSGTFFLCIGGQPALLAETDPHELSLQPEYKALALRLAVQSVFAFSRFLKVRCRSHWVVDSIRQPFCLTLPQILSLCAA